MKLKALFAKLNASGVMDRVYTDAEGGSVDELHVTATRTVSEFWMEGDHQHQSTEEAFTSFRMTAHELRILAQNCLEVANELEGYEADGTMPE